MSLITENEFISKFDNHSVNFFTGEEQKKEFYKFYKFGMYNICGLILKQNILRLYGDYLGFGLIKYSDNDFLIDIKIDNFDYNGIYHIEDIFPTEGFNNYNKFLLYNQNFILFYIHFAKENLNIRSRDKFRQDLMYGISYEKNINEKVINLLKLNYYSNFHYIPNNDFLHADIDNLLQSIINLKNSYNSIKLDTIINYNSFLINTKLEYTNLITLLSPQLPKFTYLFDMETI